MPIFLICIAIFFQSPLARAPGYFDLWVFWNIGQGQWVSHATNDYCEHFDFGGELQFFKNVQRHFINLCANKSNRLYLSHGDLDHYGFLNLISSRVSSICWMVKPTDIKLLTSNIPACSKITGRSDLNKNQTIINDCSSRNRNSCSTIFKRGRFLFSGDSPKLKERQWVSNLEHKTDIQVLLLGHHGSRTSTSSQLIANLPQLKIAIASARFGKYGHPHRETQSILKKNRIPLITTEAWGNIIFE
jgi:competence protein ComEC